MKKGCACVTSLDTSCSPRCCSEVFLASVGLRAGARSSPLEGELG